MADEAGKGAGEDPTGKPKFSLPVKGLGGSGLEGTEMSLSKRLKAAGITPSAAAGPSLALGDAASSIVSQSPMGARDPKLSTTFKARMGMGGIATPLGSDMSMRKFDFSGYDPKAMRKKKAPSPPRKVIKHEDDDMEVFVSDMTEQPDQGNLDRKNAQSSQQAKEKVIKGIYEIRQPGGMDLASQIDPVNSQKLLQAQLDVMNLQSQINEDEVEPQQAYAIFCDFESKAVQKEQELLDLQVGGEATREQQLYERVGQPNETYILPQLKLERLAVELN